MVDPQFVDIIRRLTKIETLLDNHLATHDFWLNLFLVPILVGVVTVIIQNVILLNLWKRNGKNGGPNR